MRLTAERHPSDGTLRRLVDDPAGVSDADRAHVSGCPACLTGLAAAQSDAAAVAGALAVAPATPDMDLAWRRLAAAAERAPAAAVPAPAHRRARLLRRPLVAAVAAAVVLGGAGVAAADNWLPIFHTEQVTTVQLQARDLVALPDLSSYGDLRMVSNPNVHQVDGPAAAREATGLDVPLVRELPNGVTGDPSFIVGGRLVAEFTFSAAKAERAAEKAGHALPPVPAGLDGSRFRLVAGPGVAETWSEARGLPALVVARVTAPAAFSSGVPFATARDYLLSLPGLPPDLAAQLRAFTADGSTLPIPVPADLVSTSTADVNGHRAAVLASRDGAMTGVVWVQDGMVTAVAGSLSQDEVLGVARGLG
jgi:hypothetical protein